MKLGNGTLDTTALVRRLFLHSEKEASHVSGDVLSDGTTLKMKHGNCWADGAVVYLSPTINCASHPVYAEPFILEFCGKTVQAAIQCKVKPGSFMERTETLGGQNGIAKHIDPSVRMSGRYDAEFSDNEVEWYTNDRNAVVPYRLLIRWFD